MSSTASTKYPPDLKIRVRDTFVQGSMPLSKLAQESEQRFGIKLSRDILNSWSDEGGWWNKRARNRTVCPHCGEDITDIVSGGDIDASYMYNYLITRMFDGIASSQMIDPRQVSEWRNLVKEYGLKVGPGDYGSAKSDLDKVLEKRGKENVR